MSKLKILFGATAFTLLLSCDEANNAQQFKKPFLIIGKTYGYGGDNTTLYFFQDTTGQKNSFLELNDKYSIGDVIR